MSELKFNIYVLITMLTASGGLLFGGYSAKEEFITQCKKYSTVTVNSTTYLCIEVHPLEK